MKMAEQSVAVDRPSEKPELADAAAMVARAAENCRQEFVADFGLAIGEFPPYNPEDITQNAPHAHVALAGFNADRILEYTFLGDRTLNKSRAVKIALNLLRLHLLRSGSTRGVPE
jgi:hypothetical protein